MAITYVTSATLAGGKNITSNTVAVAVTSGDQLLAITSGINGSRVTSDSQGNPWTTRATGAGIEVATATASATGTLTITVTVTTPTGNPVAHIYVIRGADIENVGMTTATGTSTAPSVTRAAAINALALGAVYTNGPSGDSYTADADTDGGVAWSAAVRAGTTGGNAASNATLASQRKILTSAATLTFNPTLGTSRAWAAGLITAPVAPAASTQARLGAIATEALSVGTPSARAAAVLTEALTTGTPSARIGAVLLEVLTPVPAPPPPLSVGVGFIPIA